MSIIVTIKKLEADYRARLERLGLNGVHQSIAATVSGYHYDKRGRVYLRIGMRQGLPLIVISNIEAYQQGKGWMTNSVLKPIQRYIHEQYPCGAYIEFENVVNDWLVDKLVLRGFSTSLSNSMSLQKYLDCTTTIM